MSAAEQTVAEPITVDFVLDLHAKGLSIVPIRGDGSKRPDLTQWEQYQDRLPTELEIRRWFGGRPRYGYGIVCGAVSGHLEMLEFEGLAIELGLLDEAEKLALDNGLGWVWNRLLAGYMEVTPRDGLHLAFRTEQARPITQLAYGEPYQNEKGETKIPVLIETRGEGGQFVAAGSGGVTHKNGRSWDLVAGSVDTIPTITCAERDQLYALLRTLDRRPPEEPPPPPTAPRSGPRLSGSSSWLTETIEDFNARESWANVLAGHFTYRFSKGTVDYWHYEGAEHDNSATVNAKGTDTLIIFSATAAGARWRTHTGGADKAPSYDKFSARCFIETGREDTATRTEFAKELQRRGFGPEWDPDADRCRFEDELSDLIGAPSGGAKDEQTAQAPPAGSLNLGDAFWSSRQKLATIRQAAHARSISADALLGVVLCRVALLTPPQTTLPPIVGDDATLDLCVAILGRSGAGKSTASRVGGRLLPAPADPGLAELSLGSGEGLIDAYFGMVTEKDADGKMHRVKRQVRRGVLFSLDEGAAFKELGSRKGSTLWPTVRSAWSGARLGQANASEDRTRHLEPSSYRFGLLSGWQLEYATALLDDSAGGTPQRFVWFSAEDPAIPDTRPEWPTAPLWEPWFDLARPLTVADEVADEIRSRALGRARGTLLVDELDAHRDLSRLKVAGLLAVLDERGDVNGDDWQLAGDVLDVSDRVRGRVQSEAAKRATETERASIARTVRAAAAVEYSAENRALAAVVNAIANHVHKGGCADGCRRRCVDRARPGKYRQWVTFDDAVDEAQRLRLVEIDGDVYRPGKLRPR